MYTRCESRNEDDDDDDDGETTTATMKSKRKRVKVASRELAWIVMETKDTEKKEDFSLKKTFPSTMFFFTLLLINMLC